ncbi:MAG TPA: hypothetical protein VFK34_13010 [Marmoricola sp.]|jgi:hypothetical protein|nr:hypothetical protein [Marmoricola sp.]
MSVRNAGQRLPLLVATLALLAPLTACGTEEARPEPVSQAVQDCRDQWGDVAQTILDMDADTTPSSLSQRWSTIIAGVDYQRHNAKGEDCVGSIEDEVQAISALRKFSSRLRVYDMEYQLRTIQPQAELYLHQPVPEPATGADGRKVRPPTHAAVEQALSVLESHAAQANAELQPAWTQANAIDLASTEELRKAVTDLDRLAQSSPAFQQCEAALQVLVAAVRAEQEAE